MQIRLVNSQFRLGSMSKSRGLVLIEILMLAFIAALIVIVLWTLLSDTAIPKMKEMIEKVFAFLPNK